MKKQVNNLLANVAQKASDDFSVWTFYQPKEPESLKKSKKGESFLHKSHFKK